MSVRKAVGMETLGFWVAEGVSMATSLGVVAIADKLIPKEIMDHATKVVAKVCIEPVQDFIEKGLNRCRVHECRVDQSKSREDRAEDYAKVFMVFGAAWALSLVVKVNARRGLNHIMGVASENVAKVPEDASIVKKILHHVPFVNWTPSERLIFAADEGIHYGLGGLILFNDKAAKIADDQIDNLSGMLQKIGVSPQKAKEISNMAIIWEAPNIAGALAGFTAIAGRHAYGWPEKHVPAKFTDIIYGKAKTEHAIAIN